MKNLLWLITACFLFALPFAAQAQFPPEPKPRPASAPQVTQAQIQAPTVPASAQVATPAVVVAAPTTLEDVRAWLNTAFLGLLTTIGGWIGIRGIRTAGTAPTGPPAVVGDILAKLADPTVRQTLEAHGLQIALTAAQNPFVNTAAAAGLSMVGAGAAEPLIRGLGIKALQDLIARQTPEAQNFGRTP
jgi:drug/metabolite transporter (DMT)-like permease